MPEETQLQRSTHEIAVDTSTNGQLRRSGVVRWYSDEKGYGFLAPDDGSEDVFVRYSAIDGDGFRCLAEGQPVTYLVGSDGRGPRASDVRPA